MGDRGTAVEKDVLEIPAVSSRSDNNGSINSFCGVKVDFVSCVIEVEERKMFCLVSPAASSRQGLDPNSSTSSQPTSRFDCLK